MHDFFQVHSGNASIITTFLNGYNEYTLLNSFKIFAMYPILPWFGLACIGYSAGYYLTHTTHSLTKQNRLFLLCALISSTAFIVLRLFNVYGDANAFIYHPGQFLLNVYSFFDVTKYPPSLQFTLITSLLAWTTLVFRSYLEKLANHPTFIWISYIGQAALFYYVFHLILICIYFFVLSQFIPVTFLKTDNLFIIYGLAAIITLTAYPFLLLFKRMRQRYKQIYPILGYM